MLIEKLKTGIKNDSRNSGSFIDDSQFRDQGTYNTRKFIYVLKMKKRSRETIQRGCKISMLKIQSRTWKEYWRIIINQETNIKVDV